MCVCVLIASVYLYIYSYYACAPTTLCAMINKVNMFAYFEVAGIAVSTVHTSIQIVNKITLSFNNHQQ